MSPSHFPQQARHHALVVARHPDLLSILDLRGPQHLPLLAHMRHTAQAWVSSLHGQLAGCSTAAAAAPGPAGVTPTQGGSGLTSSSEEAVVTAAAAVPAHPPDLDPRSAAAATSNGGCSGCSDMQLEGEAGADVGGASGAGRGVGVGGQAGVDAGAPGAPSAGPTFLLGFHSVPSMRQLHMHVVSTDFDSPALKHKKHWNSFTTPFFLPLPEVEAALAAGGAGRVVVDVEAAEELLKGEMRCYKCGERMQNMPTLTRHLGQGCEAAAGAGAGGGVGGKGAPAATYKKAGPGQRRRLG